MNRRARGTFEVKVEPKQPPPAEGLMRMSINKQIHGELEATTKGEMLSGGNPQAGVAGYVAMEMVTGALHGKRGSFALQHSGTMDASGPKLSVSVVPGSGTGELAGLGGTFTIIMKDDDHAYELEYTLPG